MYGSAADYFIYIGFLGLVIVFISFLIFSVRRIGWIFGILFGMTVGSPNYKSGIIKFIILVSFFVVIGIFTYTNFYIRAYPPYSLDKPSAEVILFPGNGNSSQISINIQRDERKKTTQGASMENGSYLLIGEILTAPEWLKPFGVTDGFRFDGLIKGNYTTGYNEHPVDISVSEKPNDFVWKILIFVQELIPLVEIEKHYMQFSADGFRSNFDVYVTPSGFKRN